MNFSNECYLCTSNRVLTDLVSLHDDRDTCKCCYGCREKIRPTSLNRVLQACPFCHTRTNVRGLIGRDGQFPRDLRILEGHHSVTINQYISQADINYFTHVHNNISWNQNLRFDDIELFNYTTNFAHVNLFWYDGIIKALLELYNLQLPDIDTIMPYYDFTEFMLQNINAYPRLNIPHNNFGGVRVDYVINELETERHYFDRVFSLIHPMNIPIISNVQINEVIDIYAPVVIHPVIDIPLEPIINLIENDPVPAENYEIQIVIEDNINQIVFPYPRRRRNLFFDTMCWIIEIICYINKRIINNFVILRTTLMCIIHQVIILRNYINEQYEQYESLHGYIRDVPDQHYVGDIRPIVFGNSRTLVYRFRWFVPIWLSFLFHHFYKITYQFICHCFCNQTVFNINHNVDLFSDLNAMNPSFTGIQTLNPFMLRGTYSNIYSTLGYSHYYMGIINVPCYEHIISTRIAQVESNNVANTIAANVSLYFVTNGINVTDEIRVNTSMYCLQRIRMMQYRMNDIPSRGGSSFMSVPF